MLCKFSVQSSKTFFSQTRVSAGFRLATLLEAFIMCHFLLKFCFLAKQSFWLNTFYISSQFYVKKFPVARFNSLHTDPASVTRPQNQCRKKTKMIIQTVKIWIVADGRLLQQRQTFRMDAGRNFSFSSFSITSDSVIRAKGVNYHSTTWTFYQIVHLKNTD